MSIDPHILILMILFLLSPLTPTICLEFSYFLGAVHYFSVCTCYHIYCSVGIIGLSCLFIQFTKRYHLSLTILYSSSRLETLDLQGSERSVQDLVTEYFSYPKGICLRRQWHPTPVLLPGKSHGWRSLVGCGPWGR